MNHWLITVSFAETVFHRPVFWDGFPSFGRSWSFQVTSSLKQKRTTQQPHRKAPVPSRWQNPWGRLSVSKNPMARKVCPSFHAAWLYNVIWIVRLKMTGLAKWSMFIFTQVHWIRCFFGDVISLMGGACYLLDTRKRFAILDKSVTDATLIWAARTRRLAWQISPSLRRTYNI